MKLWAGRFQKELDARTNDFNSSISFDARMYAHDIRGSIAHATMLAAQGVIDAHEAERIIEGPVSYTHLIDLQKQGLEAMIRAKTGLPIDAYFSATKLQWILEHVPDAKMKARNGELLCGTVDTLSLIHICTVRLCHVFPAARIG